LQAVVSMPSGVFQPYSGVGTAVLVFVKGGETDKVWFYDMKADGYSLDQRRDFIDGKGDIEDLLTKFRKGRAESGNSILVKLETIKKNGYNLSIARYKEVKQDEAEYEEPEVLIEKLSKLEKEISAGLDELKKSI